MQSERKERVARATAELLRAVRELARARPRDRRQTALPLDSAPINFRRAVEKFTDALAS
jgi:hypothetical protein